MVEILLAPAASGKTQTAAAALREARGLRMGLVPGSSQVAALLGGLEGVRVPVLTFYGLASRILRRAGQGRPRLLDGQTRLRLTRTLLRELAGAGQLGAYAAVALKPGFVSAAAELLADLGAAGIMPDAFAAAARTPHDADMSALYSAYIERQASSGLADMSRRLILARDALRAQPALLSDLALLAVDGFDQFTLVQLELLAAVAGRVPQTLITLTGSVPARPAHLRFRRTLDELQAALPEARVQVLTSDLDDVVVPTLRYLEQHLFELEPPPPHTLPPAVHVVEAPDRGREVRAALRHALSLVAQGAEPTSIAVLLRETGAYLPLLDETAREYGLPLDLQAGLPLVDSPPISALLALLQLRLDDYPRRGLVAALRSPFLTAGTTEQNSTKKERRRRGTGRPSVIRRPASSIQRPSSRPPATSHQPPAISGTYAALLDQIGRAMGVSGGLDGWRAVLTRLADPAELEKDRAAPRILVEPAQALELLSTIEQLNGWLTPPERLTAASYSAWVRQRLAALNCSRCGERDLAALQRMRQLLGEIERADRRADGSEQASDDLLADLTGTIEKAHYLARNPDGVAIIPMLAARGLQFEHVLILGMSEGQIPQPLAEPAIYARAGRRRRGPRAPVPDALPNPA
jgi:superfamily I DNA/RNA helicase